MMEQVIIGMVLIKSLLHQPLDHSSTIDNVFEGVRRRGKTDVRQDRSQIRRNAGASLMREGRPNNEELDEATPLYTAHMASTPVEHHPHDPLCKHVLNVEPKRLTYGDVCRSEYHQLQKKVLTHELQRLVAN